MTAAGITLELFGELGRKLRQLFGMQAGGLGGRTGSFFSGALRLALIGFFFEALAQRRGSMLAMFVGERFGSLAVEVEAMRGFFERL